MLPKSSLAVTSGAFNYLGHTIDGKNHEMKLKSDYSANHTKLNYITNYLCLGAYIHTHTYPHEGDFKKPGMNQPIVGAPGLKT